MKLQQTEDDKGEIFHMKSLSLVINSPFIYLTFMHLTTARLEFTQRTLPIFILVLQILFLVLQIYLLKQ